MSDLDPHIIEGEHGHMVGCSCGFIAFPEDVDCYQVYLILRESPVCTTDGLCATCGEVVTLTHILPYGVEGVLTLGLYYLTPTPPVPVADYMRRMDAAGRSN